MWVSTESMKDTVVDVLQQQDRVDTLQEQAASAHMLLPRASRHVVWRPGLEASLYTSWA